MLVRTLRPHFNEYGGAYAKAVGDEYDHSSPEALIERGVLEVVEVEQPKPAGKAKKA